MIDTVALILVPLSCVWLTCAVIKNVLREYRNSKLEKELREKYLSDKY